jgi:sulfotransferase family protein
MWSGPRTLSTALMRSFGNRPDTVVVDEPLYGYYLAETGINHPGRDEILASMPTRWPEVVGELTSGPLPAGVTVHYQKHMTHHLLPAVDRNRLAGLRHAFLIRDPTLLLASYAKVRDTPTLADLGLEQQVEIYRRFGGPVIDAADLAARPRQTLQALCDALRIRFDEAMLSWPAGPRPTDGVWAKHWYARVWASTGFGSDREPARPSHSGGDSARPDDSGGDGHSGGDSGGADDSRSDARPASLALPASLEALAARCRPFYEELAAACLSC